MAPVTLTVSIVTYQPDLVLLERCLVSLATALDAARGEGILRDANVVLVDNTGSRTTAEAVVHLGESRFRGSGWTMNYLHRHTNIGYGRAHNLVMHGGNTHYHLVLNPDVELAPDALVAGMRFLDAHPEIGVLAPAVSALRAFAPAALRRWCRARLDRYEMRDAIEAVSGDGFVSPVPLLSGCFMLARRKPVDASGGFDPAYFLYFEDFDWSVRLNRITGSAYVPSVKIVHHGGGAARKGARHLAHFARSAVRFYRKHGWKWV